MLKFLEEEQIDPQVINGIKEFRKAYAPETEAAENAPLFLLWKERVGTGCPGSSGRRKPAPGRAKATGKNVLAENLAAAFGRPVYNVSLHINADAASMLGTDTFKNGEVTFRPGPVSEAAAGGGFCVLDEINMARNEALAVLHSVLDFRRFVQIPGYKKIRIHGATRFIATMNYGYAGTRELNEALSSRFMILIMPEIAKEDLSRLLTREFPAMKPDYVRQFTSLFIDIRDKCRSGELTEKVLDLRGLTGALRMMQGGLAPCQALDMGLTNKTPDEYEQSLVRDIIASRISKKTDAQAIFRP